VAHSVVIVDDEPSARKLAHHWLDRSPEFEVIAEARDGEEAIRLAAKFQPELILLDLVMPGIAALPHIRRRSPGSKVVVLSMLQQESVREDALALGAAAFIDKATEGPVLLDHLRQICGVNAGPAS
jgi:DNA-binding NarL/FixJ family response regulator